MMPDSRHFPPPWSIAEYNDARFIVRDHNGQALAYVYCEEEPGRRAAVVFVLTVALWQVTVELGPGLGRCAHGFV